MYYVNLEIPVVLRAKEIVVLWMCVWTECRKQIRGDLLNIFWACKCLFPPFLSFLWPGKGQEKKGNDVEEGIVSAVSGSPSKCKDLKVSFKSPKQRQNLFRYAPSAPSTRRQWGGVLFSHGLPGRNGTQWERNLFVSRSTNTKSTILLWRHRGYIPPTHSLPRYLFICIHAYLCPGILLKENEKEKAAKQDPVLSKALVV